MRLPCLNKEYYDNDDDDDSVILTWQRKTSFEKNCFQYCVGEYAEYGLINKGWYGMFFASGIWCLDDVSSVSPSSEEAFER